MARLPLHSLHVEGFRALSNLKLDELKRVNLIVGKNNVGKTYLLESIRLYMHRGSPEILETILSERDEAPYRRANSTLIETGNGWLESIKNMFYGRPASADTISPIRIGPIDSRERRCEIRVGWHILTAAEEGQRRWIVASQPSLFPFLEGGDAHPVLQIIWGGREIASLPIERLGEGASRWALQRRDADVGPLAACQYVRSGGPDAAETGLLWDNVALTDLEEDVTAALRLIDKRIERVTLVLAPGHAIPSRHRIGVVKLSGLERPVTLRSMGEGTNRMFGLVLALVNARDGVLLIDEIENGFHYTVLPRLWKLVITMARRLNVQVFATTHSWDCIEAFQAAIHRDMEDDAMLIRLESREGEVRSVAFSKDELAIVTRDHIEVR